MAVGPNVYTASTTLGHRAPRPFSHGVLCGCDDEPNCCTSHCFLVSFCPCFVLARLRALEGALLSTWPRGDFRAQVKYGKMCYTIAFIGYAAVAALVPLILSGRALPPPPPPARADPTYYIRFPAYLALVGHLGGALLVLVLRRHYRMRHRITRVSRGPCSPLAPLAAESLTDEDEMCASPCCCLCARCDNAAWALLCSCCLLLQMADDYVHTTGETLFEGLAFHDRAGGVFADPTVEAAAAAAAAKEERRVARAERARAGGAEEFAAAWGAGSVESAV